MLRDIFILSHTCILNKKGSSGEWGVSGKGEQKKIFYALSFLIRKIFSYKILIIKKKKV